MPKAFTLLFLLPKLNIFSLHAMSMLQVKGVVKELQGVKVVDGVSFEQEYKQKLAIAGETGSGKSTLLKIICGWVQPDAGEMIFKGERIIGPEEQLLPGHPGIAYLSQHFELRNHYRVHELLEMALQLEQPDADKIFEVCRISHLLKRRTDQLSGGEKQRIATARLLISAPKLLLLDEPYSNLDMVHRNILKEVIKDIGEQLNITCLLISHDPVDILSWADRILVMKAGKIVEDSTPVELYRRPVNGYVAGLFGKYNHLSPQQYQRFQNHALSHLKDQSVFFRPEQFTMNTNGNGVAGNIVNIEFLGSYYDVTILLDDFEITLRTLHLNAALGDKVYVQLNAW